MSVSERGRVREGNGTRKRKEGKECTTYKFSILFQKTNGYVHKFNGNMQNNNKKCLQKTS